MRDHELCQQARHVPCSCGAMPDQDCLCDVPGVHLGRFARARGAGLLTHADIAYVIADADVFTGTTIVLDVAS